MPKITVEIEWNTPDDPFWLSTYKILQGLRIYYGDTLFVVRESKELSASEALYAFIDWLSIRSERVTISIRDDPGTIMTLVDEFCKANHLAKPREGWDHLRQILRQYWDDAEVPVEGLQVKGETNEPKTAEQLMTTEEQIWIVMLYTGWDRQTAKAAICQWKEAKPDWNAGDVRKLMQSDAYEAGMKTSHKC